MSNEAVMQGYTIEVIGVLKDPLRTLDRAFLILPVTLVILSKGLMGPGEVIRMFDTDAQEWVTVYPNMFRWYLPDQKDAGKPGKEITE